MEFFEETPVAPGVLENLGFTLTTSDGKLSFLGFVVSKVPLALAAYGALVAIGWMTEESEEEKAKRNKMPSAEEVLAMSPQEQQEFFNEKFSKLSAEEQEDFAKEIQAAQRALASGTKPTSKSGATRSGGKAIEDGKGKEEENITLLLTRADTARQQGKLDQSEGYYNQALAMMEADPEIGPNHYFSALIQYALALIKKEKGENEKSEELILKILPIFRKESEKEVSFADLSEVTSFYQVLGQYSDILASLADLYFTMERYDEVEPSLNGAFSIVNKKAKILDNLAIRTAEDKKFIDQLRNSIKYEVAILKDNMSRLRWKQKKYTEAETLGKDSLKVLIDGLIEKKELMSIVVKAMNRLSEIYTLQGKSEDGFYEELLSSQEEAHGENSDQVLVTLPLLGVSFFNKHNYAQAEKFYRRAIVLLGNQDDAESDKNNMTLLTFTNDLASSLQEQGKDQEAQELRKFFKDRISKTHFNPPSSLSRYLKTISCILKFDPNSMGERTNIYYEAAVESKERELLPKGAVLEFNFENPVIGEEPYKVDYEVEEGKQTITVKSPNLPEIQRGYYSIPIFIFSNSSKTEKIGSHYLWCRSPIDANENESYEDTTLKIYESNSESGFGQGGGLFSF